MEAFLGLYHSVFEKKKKEQNFKCKVLPFESPRGLVAGALVLGVLCAFKESSRKSWSLEPLPPPPPGPRAGLPSGPPPVPPVGLHSCRGDAIHQKPNP